MNGAEHYREGERILAAIKPAREYWDGDLTDTVPAEIEAMQALPFGLWSQNLELARAHFAAAQAAATAQAAAAMFPPREVVGDPSAELRHLVGGSWQLAPEVVGALLTRFRERLDGYHRPADGEQGGCTCDTICRAITEAMR